MRHNINDALILCYNLCQGRGYEMLSMAQGTGDYILVMLWIPERL